jgi:hypothetical protein
MRTAKFPTLPSATGRDPWGNLRDDPPAPPEADLEYLAFGGSLVTQDPRYESANLPPLT